MSRRLLLTVVLAAVGAGVVISSALAGGKAIPPPARVRMLGLAAHTAVGNYCEFGEADNGSHYRLCVDRAYPLATKGSLPARPGGVFVVDLKRTATVAFVQLVRVEDDHMEEVGRIDGEPVDDRRSRWRFRLPADLEGADALSIWMAHQGEDANYWAGITPVEAWPAGGHSGGRRPALVTIHRLTARAALGTHCLPSGTPEHPAVGCADYAYPLDPRGRLPATPNARVRILLRKKATAVSGSLVRPDGKTGEFVGPQLTALPAGEAGRRWRLRLPDHLHGATALDFSVDYTDGDANYWAGLRPVERWRR